MVHPTLFPLLITPIFILRLTAEPYSNIWMQKYLLNQDKDNQNKRISEPRLPYTRGMFQVQLEDASEREIAIEVLKEIRHLPSIP